MTEAHETAWPATVASALPATPHLSAITNRALNTVHAIAPISMVMNARNGAPAVRMKLLMPMPTIWNTKPMPTICMNVRAYGRASSVALEIVSSHSTAGVLTRMATNTATIMESVNVLPRLISASSWRPSPRRSAASALPPLPTSMASAIITTMAGNATVTAVRPISPTPCPRKMESMTL